MKSIRNVLAGSLLVGGALLATATCCSIASAQDGSTDAMPPSAEGHHEHHHGGGMWHMYAKLGLTAEQKASMKSIMAAAKPQMQTLHQQMRANQLKLMQTPPGSTNYNAVVSEVAQSNATLASQRTTQAAQLQAQMYALLTPPQKTQLATLQAQWAAKAAARTSAQ